MKLKTKHAAGMRDEKGKVNSKVYINVRICCLSEARKMQTTEEAF